MEEDLQRKMKKLEELFERNRALEERNKWLEDQYIVLKDQKERAEAYEDSKRRRRIADLRGRSSSPLEVIDLDKDE